VRMQVGTAPYGTVQTTGKVHRTIRVRMALLRTCVPEIPLQTGISLVDILIGLLLLNGSKAAPGTFFEEST